MFGRSTSQRFDFTPTSDTPGPGSYEIAASTLLHANPHSSKKSAAFGDSKRWTDIEALITKSNPLLLLPATTTTATTTAANDRKRVRESVAGGVGGVRRMTVSSQGKRHRGDEEDGDGKKVDNSRERAEWETERQKHADTQRELLRRLKEIKDDWDGEKSALQQQLEQLQHQSEEKDKQIAATNETMAALAQQNDDSAKQMQAQLEAASKEKEVISAQLLTLTAAHDSITQRVASQQQLIDRLEAAASQHQADIELHIKLLSEERQWRQELEGSISAVHVELNNVQAAQTLTAQQLADKQEEVAALKAVEVELNAELRDSRGAADELRAALLGSTKRLTSLEAEMHSAIEQMRSQQQHRERLELELQTLQGEREQLNTTAARTTEQLAGLQKDLEQSTSLNETYCGELVQAEERMRAVEERVAQANHDMNALQQRMEHTISNMQSSHTAEVEQLQLRLQQQQAERDSSAMQWEAEKQQQSASIITLEQQLQSEKQTRGQLQQTAAEVDLELIRTRELHAESVQQAAEKQTSIEALTAAATQLNAQLATNAQTIATLSHQLNDSQAGAAAVQRDMDTAVQQLRAQYDEARLAWQVEGEQHIATIDLLEQQLADQKTSTQQLETAITAVRAELENMQSAHNDTAQQSAERQAEVKRLTAAEAELLAHLTSSQFDTSALQAQLDDSNAHLVALQHEMEATIQGLRKEHQHTVSALTGEMSALCEQQKAEQLSHAATVDQLTASLAESTAKIAIVTNELEQLGTAKANAERDWLGEQQQHSSSMATIHQQLAGQQQTCQQLEADLATVNSLLQEAKKLQAHTETAAAEKQARIEELIAAAATLQAELNRTLSTVASLEARLSTSQSNLTSLTHDNEQLRSSVSELQLGTEAQQQVMTTLRGDNKHKAEEAEKLKGELAGVRNELVNLYSHHTEQTMEYSEKCQELDAMKQRLSEKDDSLQLMQEEHVQLIDEYAAAKLETRTSREQLEQMAEQLNSLNQHVAQLTQQRDECMAEKAGLEREITALETKFEDITSQQRTLATAHSILQTEHSHAVSQLQVEQATSISLRQQGEDAVAELMLVRERWAQGSDQVERLQEAVRELEAVVTARGEDVERAKQIEAQLQSRLDELIVQQVEAGQWKDKYEQSRELCLLLKADTERKQQQLTAAVDERKREEAKLHAAIDKLDKQLHRDKDKHSTALKDEEERHKREAVVEKRRHAQEMARMTAEKDELNRSTNREISEYKRGNVDMQRRMEAAEAKLTTMTAMEAKLLQEKMSAERRVKELNTAVSDKEKEMERLTAAVREQLTKQLVQPLQQTNTRLQSRVNELEATVTSQSTAVQQLHDVTAQFTAFKAEVVSMTSNYEYSQSQLRALQDKNDQLSAAMADMAGHSNDRQRIHMHQMIKEENKALKQQLEAAQRQLLRHRREVQRLGGAVVEEEEGGGERRKTHGVVSRENAVEGEPSSGKEPKTEGRKTMGPRHRTVLSSMN